MAIASKELRTKAVEAYKTGKFTQQQLADAYGVHYKTIQNWLKADANGEGQEPKKRGTVQNFSHFWEQLSRTVWVRPAGAALASDTRNVVSRLQGP